MRLIYRGIADSDGAAAKCFLPRHAVQASNAGHTVELLICYECSRIQVYVDGTRVETVKTDNGVEPGVSALFEDAGLEIEGR